MLERGDHGWIEAISSGVSDSSEATVRFHERVGGLMALLHVLEAADLTSTHLVARGEHPVLVDAETLFQSRARHRPGGGTDDHGEGGNVAGGNVVGHNVEGRNVEGAAGGRSRCGVLPNRCCEWGCCRARGRAIPRRRSRQDTWYRW